MSADYAPFPRAELEAFAQFSPIKGVSRACREALLHYDATQERMLLAETEVKRLKTVSNANAAEVARLRSILSACEGTQKRLSETLTK